MRRTDSVRIKAVFSPGQTLFCGQTFSFKETSPGVYEGVSGGRFLRLYDRGEELELICGEGDFPYWENYFDLKEDYGAKKAELSKISPVLKEAIAYSPGIRLLRQEPWEALCAFILSQNNNIGRITGLVSRLCQIFGEPVCEGYAFPSPQKLKSQSLEDLSPLRAGFRAKYLLDAAEKVAGGEVSFKDIDLAGADFGRGELRKILGVGPKVAECTLLFGFHKTECFPMDVWMKRVMKTLLPGVTPEDFGENAGLAQQYLYEYARNHPGLFT